MNEREEFSPDEEAVAANHDDLPEEMKQEMEQLLQRTQQLNRRIESDAERTHDALEAISEDVEESSVRIEEALIRLTPPWRRFWVRRKFKGDRRRPQNG